MARSEAIKQAVKLANEISASLPDGNENHARIGYIIGVLETLYRLSPPPLVRLVPHQEEAMSTTTVNKPSGRIPA